MEKHCRVLTQKSGFTSILNFLTAQDWLRQNSDPAITHAGSKERNLLFFDRLPKYCHPKKFNKVREELDEQRKERNQQDRTVWSKKRGGRRGTGWVAKIESA